MNHFWESYLRINVYKAKGINKKEKDIRSMKESSIPGLPVVMSPHWSGEWKALEEIHQGEKGGCDISFVEANIILAYHLAL